LGVSLLSEAEFKGRIDPVIADVIRNP
jgi:hypothetical protein